MPLEVEVAEGAFIPPAAAGELDRQYRDKGVLGKNPLYLEKIWGVIGIRLGVEVERLGRGVFLGRPTGGSDGVAESSDFSAKILTEV